MGKDQVKDWGSRDKVMQSLNTYNGLVESTAVDT